MLYSNLLKIFFKSNFSIDVYEGQSAGNLIKYSAFNYSYGIRLIFNFHDKFADAVYKDGMKIVKTVKIIY